MWVYGRKTSHADIMSFTTPRGGTSRPLGRAGVSKVGYLNISCLSGRKLLTVRLGCVIN